MTRAKCTNLKLQHHIEQWCDIGKHLNSILAPLQNSIISAAESFGLMQEHFLETVSAIEFPEAMLGEVAPHLKQAEDYRNSLNSLISPALEGLQQSFKELPPRTQEALKKLGEHGWYLDLTWPIPTIWKLEKALLEGQTSEAEEALIEYYEDQIDRIEDTIIARFPNRERFVRAGFGAHRRQEYALSIPVLLAQTDGITKDVTNESLFMKERKQPKTARYVKRLTANSYLEALCSPLARVLPIQYSPNQRGPHFSGLNRHMVLHGESLDYDTKTNSIKAISLINYISDVLDLSKPKSLRRR